MPIIEMKITIAGLYDYDNTIFDNLNLPAATDDLPGADKETAVFEILENCNDFEVMYPDADYIKESIGYWSTAMHFLGLECGRQSMNNIIRYITLTGMKKYMKKQVEITRRRLTPQKQEQKQLITLTIFRIPIKLHRAARLATREAANAK